MNQVFVDTAAWIALLNIDDVWHQAAHRVRSDLVDKNYLFLTTDFVLIEVADALCLPRYKKKGSTELTVLNFRQSLTCRRM